MDNHITDTLSVRGLPQERKKNKGSGGRSKSKGTSKSPGKGISKCQKCGKVGYYKNECRSKNVEKEKGYEDTPSTEVKNSSEEGGDVYLASTGNPLERDTWLIDSGVSCHMTPHREWFCEYEKYNGGYVYLGDDSLASIIGHRMFNSKLKNGRIRALPGLLQIPYLKRT